MPRSAEQLKQKRLNVHEGGPKFRSNGFFVFRQTFAVVHGLTDQKLISVWAARAWKTLPEEWQAFYEAHAELQAGILNWSYNCSQDVGGGLEMLTEWQGENFFIMKIRPRQEESGSSGNGQ
ncbi:2337_t:CDS:1 [Paraglomus occultum]|uniref:2337_t:CDS:1 n=1 Tax=Paraglomus occultum TaxID=144539 RepID=A0A9N9C6Q4_9GLOM|nr:2337_t:CDS:1 [Paraglomus occultum]